MGDSGDGGKLGWPTPPFATYLSTSLCINCNEFKNSALRIHSTQVYKIASPGCHISKSNFRTRLIWGIQEPDAWSEDMSGAACRGYAGGRTTSRRTGGSEDRDKWCSCISTVPPVMTKTFIGFWGSTGISNFKQPLRVSLETQSG